MTSTARTSGRLAIHPGSRMLLDVAIAAAALAGTLIQLVPHGGISVNPPGARELDPAGLLLAVLSAAPLIGWRRFPRGVFVVTATACVALAGLGYPIDLMVGPAAAIYLLAASREPNSRWTTSTTVTIVSLLAAYLAAAAVARATLPSVELLHTGLAAAGAWFAGERTRLRREQLAAFAERALRAEQAAEQDRLLAVAEERARIARDLHDSAGHAISLIAVRAGAARLHHPQDPDRSPAAFAAIEDLARHTVAEIDQFVGTLRDSGSADSTATVPPGLASLETLIAHHATTGLTVTVDRTGDTPPPSGAVDQAAYRILQEALTNAARHGTGSARVALAFSEEAMDLTVTNPVAADRESRPGGGHGLIGMRERATVLGGRLDAMRANGAFRVHARIPYRGHRP